MNRRARTGWRGRLAPERAARCPRAGRSRRGFTLIEVLGAIVIVSVGLMSTFYLVGMGTAMNTDAKAVAQAYQAAQQEIENLRNIPFETLKPITLSAPAAGVAEERFLQADGQPDASRPGDDLDGKTYPGDVPALAKLPNGRGGLILTGTQYKTVTVIVRWTDPGNKERSVAVGTLIAKGGIDPR